MLRLSFILSMITTRLLLAAASVDDAAFISQTVPKVLQAGQTVTVAVTVRNAGTSKWTAKGGFALGSQNPPNNMLWGSGRVTLNTGEVIPPNGTKTFSFSVTAPDKPGTYAFQWKMVKEFSGFFGEATPNTAIVIIGQDWLSHLYDDVLGRQPKAKDVTNAETKLSKGVSFEQVSLGVLTLSEGAKKRVQEQFQRLLGREPRPEELKQWTPVVQKLGMREFFIKIASTDEYFLLQGGTEIHFLSALFMDFLYAPPEDLESWLTAMEQGKFSREKIVQHFLTSEAYLAQTVIQWYRKYLHLPVEQLGSRPWVWIEKLKHAERMEDVLAQFLASSEYMDEIWK